MVIRDTDATAIATHGNKPKKMRTKDFQELCNNELACLENNIIFWGGKKH